jgi:hypothetical protein
MITCGSRSAQLPLRIPDLTEEKILAGLTEIKPSAFQKSSWIREIIIPEGYTKIGERVFFKCINVVNVTLPSTMKHIGPQAFEGCRKLQNINLDHVEIFGQESFKNCGKLSTLNLTRAVTIGAAAFNRCYQARIVSNSNRVDIGVDIGVERDGVDRGEVERGEVDGNVLVVNPKLSFVKTIGRNAFMGSRGGNRKIIYFRDLKSLGSNAFTHSDVYGINCKECCNLINIGIGAFAFSKLRRFVFPERNKIKVLRQEVFKYCDLKTVTLPRGMEEIERYAFYCCKDLETVTLPRGVQEIQKCAFYCCKVLKRVKWSCTVRRIGEGAFKNCASLVKPPELAFSHWTSIGKDAFDGCKPPALFENPNVFVEISANKLHSDVCGICLDSFTTVPACQLSCKHLFHQNCAHQWHQRNPTCSKCRQPVTSVAIVLSSDECNYCLKN